MNTSTFEAFEADARAAGFDEALERHWAPDTVIDTHSHAFDVEAVVTQGEMWLTCDGSTRHLSQGDTFTLARHLPHAERYGPKGATYWVARRNPRWTRLKRLELITVQFVERVDIVRRDLGQLRCLRSRPGLDRFVRSPHLSSRRDSDALVGKECKSC